MERVLGVALQARVLGAEVAQLVRELHGPVRVAQERCADDRIVGWQGEVGAPDGGDRIPQRLRVRRAAVRMLCVSSM